MKYKVIYLLFIFSLINFNRVDAFFLINDHPDKMRIDHTITDRSSQEVNSFQLYDNFFYNNTDSFLLKKLDGFISVDQVEISIPLKILTKDSIYPENSIDRMLLANLRIKNLLSAYEEIQKKALSMIQDSHLKTDGRKNDDKRRGETADNESEKDRMNKKLFNIYRLSRLNQENVSSKEATLFDADSNEKNKTVSSILIENNLNQVKTTINSGKQIFTRQNNSELPWIFTLFLKILNYVLANRVEIILYMIFIAAAGFFISLQVKR